MSASNMLNRANTLVNVGYAEDLGADTACGEPSMSTDDLRSGYTNSQSDYTDLRNSFVNAIRKLVTPIEKIQEEYINEEMGILNRKGGKFLTRVYGNNEEFREETINFVRDKEELDPELILDKRSKTNTLNTLGNKYLAECITSKDNKNI